MNNALFMRILLATVLMVTSHGFAAQLGGEQETKEKGAEAAVIPDAPLLEPAHQKETKEKKTQDVAAQIKNAEALLKEQGVPTTPLLHDVIMFLNTAPEEGLAFITSQFGLALCQKTVPMLITGAALYGFLRWRYGSDALFISPSERAQLTFSDDDWDAFKTTDGALYLFIPRTYRDAKLAAQPANVLRVAGYKPRELFLGFAVDSKNSGLEQISVEKMFIPKDSTPEEVEQTLSSVRSDTPITINQVLGLLVPSGYWNILLCGHGIYSKGFNLTAAELRKSTHAVSESEVSGGSVAGLSFFDFKQLLAAMVNDFKVNMLVYSTCFGGDAHTILPYSSTYTTEFLMLSNDSKVLISDATKIPFTIVSAAVTSSESSTSAPESLQYCLRKKAIPATKPNFKEFFETIHRYSFVDLPKHFTNEELKRILDRVIPHGVELFNTQTRDRWGVRNIPWVKDPSSETFRPFPLNQYQQLINTAWVQKHVLEASKTVEFNNMHALLVSASEVSVPLSITVAPETPAPAIIAMTPGIALITFESITTTSTFSDFFIQSMAAVGALHKYFYIKELTVINDLQGPGATIGRPVTIYNVLVCLNRDELLIFFTDLHGDIYCHLADSIAEKWGTQVKLTEKTIAGSVHSFIKDNEWLNNILNYFNIVFPSTSLLSSEVAKTMYVDFSKLLSKEDSKLLADARETEEFKDVQEAGKSWKKEYNAARATLKNKEKQLAELSKRMNATLAVFNALVAFLEKSSAQDHILEYISALPLPGALMAKVERSSKTIQGVLGERLKELAALGAKKPSAGTKVKIRGLVSAAEDEFKKAYDAAVGEIEHFSEQTAQVAQDAGFTPSAV